MEVANQSAVQVQPEFADIEVSPSQLRDAKFIRTRGFNTNYKMVEYFSVVLPDGREVRLYDTVSKTQLVSRAGGKISELRRIYQWDERDTAFRSLLAQRSEPVILRLARHNGTWTCYAVVTSKFTEVRHSELYRIVESELTSRGMTWQEVTEFKTNRRVWRTYLFQRNVGVKVGDIVQVGMRVANSVKATSSIIFYPFWKRLVCSNGMTSSKGVWKPATTHTGLKVDILQSVKDTLTEALEQAFGFERLVERAMSIRLEDKQIDVLIREVSSRRGFADYVQRSIRYRMQSENKTLWGLANSFTWVSSHDKLPDQSKLVVEQSAHWLLAGGEETVRELTTPKPSPSVQPVLQVAQAVCRSCKQNPVPEVGELCNDCETQLRIEGREQDAFDHRMGLDNEDGVV
jgi:hypothetical protein